MFTLSNGDSAMKYHLHMECCDTKPEVKDFDRKEDAIEHAVSWFLGPYMDDDDVRFRELLQDDVGRLRSDLAAGKEFLCNTLYERIYIETMAA